MSAAELILATGSAPAAPASGRLTLYADEDGGLYIKAADGLAYRLATANGDLVLAAGAQLTVPTSGTAVLKQGSPTAGRVAQWHDPHTVGQCDIRVSSGGAVGIGMDAGADAAGNLAVAGDVQVQGKLEASDIALTNNQMGERAYALSVGTPPAALDLLTATLNSNSDALLVRCTILLAGVANVWACYHGYAAAWYQNGTAGFSASISAATTQGSPQAPVLAWQGSGNTRTLSIQNNQTSSLLTVWVQLAPRAVNYSWL